MNKYTVMFRYGDVRTQRNCKEFIVMADTAKAAVIEAMSKAETKFDIHNDFMFAEDDFACAINNLFYEETFHAEIQCN